MFSYQNFRSQLISIPDGREKLNRTVFDLEDLNQVFTFMKDGHYKPTNCTPKQSVAIIVPYRDREPQMKIFLNNVIPRIYRQQLEFGIYIVEQVSISILNTLLVLYIVYICGYK